MSQQHPERASNTKALENMTAMITQPLLTFAESGEGRIQLRFARDLWNDFQPGTQAITTSSPKPRAVQKKKGKLPDTKREEDAIKKAPTRLPPQQKQCKVKVTRFQYGGPDARVAGRHMNDITLEASCLRPTCANCWQWHAHLMRDPLVTNSSLNEHTATAPEASPLSPAIAPRIVDDRWRMHQSRRNSTTDVSGLTIPSAHVQGVATPVLTPANEVWTFNQAADLDVTYNKTATASIPSKYNIFVPTHLLEYTAPAAQSKTHWRTTPRQQCTARLLFVSEVGKAKYRAFLHNRGREEIRGEHTRLRRTTKQIVRETLSTKAAHSADSVQRRRHRIRLTFNSQVGKESYRRLVERYLR